MGGAMTLTAENFWATEDLVMEQLATGYIEPSNSPWNTPIFVIRKNQENGDCYKIWGIITTMEEMGALQPGLPPQWLCPFNILIDLDLQDCFFTIPLAVQDCKSFAFSLPSSWATQPFRRLGMEGLPQRMKNTPTTFVRNLWLKLYKLLVKYKDIFDTLYGWYFGCP